MSGSKVSQLRALRYFRQLRGARGRKADVRQQGPTGTLGGLWLRVERLVWSRRDAGGDGRSAGSCCAADGCAHQTGLGENPQAGDSGSADLGPGLGFGGFNKPPR